ncbi:MAG: tetratricopeptide repeat protein [Bacteroidaceae bacterium]|nr:tetratricopeptide repeat protein [Bacteroidaceae bacterium]
MKKYLLLFLLCGSLSVQAQDIGTTGGNYTRADIPERQLQQAHLLFNEHQYDMAEKLLQELLASAPTAAQEREAASLLVLIAYHRNVATASGAIEKYLRTYPDAPEYNRMKALALLSHYAQNHYGIVTRGMHDVDPDMLCDAERDKLILAYALSMIQEGRHEEAAAQLGILKVISRQYSDEIVFYTAYTDYATRRYEEAYEGFKQAKTSSTYQRQACYYLAATNLELKDYAAAEAEAAAYIEARPKDELTLEMKRIQGEALYGQQRYLQAAIVLEEYLAEADEPNRDALYQLGMAHFNSGEYLRAPEVLAMVSDGDDAIAQSAQLHAGLSFLKLDDKNKARLCFEQAAALTAEPKLRERAMYNYTVCVHETSYVGFGESVQVLERFLNEFPNSIYADQVNSYLVETYMNTKNYDAALASIAKIQQPSSVVLEAKQNLLYKAGAEAFANGNIDKAITKLNESLKVGNYDRQTGADALFWRGEAYYRGGNYRQAARDYAQYLNLTGERRGRTYALALYGLGYAQFLQKNYQDAFKQFTQLQQSYAAASGAIDKTTLADAQMRIGDCYYQSRQYNAAEEAYNKAINIDPSVTDYAIYQKAFAQGLTGRYTEKIGTLTYLIESYPQSDFLDDALYEKGRAYIQLDQGSQAIHVFEQLTTQFPQSQYAPKAGNEIALIHYQNNQIRSAIKAYKMVILNYPGSEQADIAMRDLKNLYVEENMVDSYIEFASQTQGMVKVDVSERDSLTYKAAELAYARGDEKAAIDGFTKYLSQFNNGAYIVAAQYYLGCVYYKQNNYDQARFYLQRVGEHRNSKYYEEATRMMADLAYNHKDYALAMEAYGTLIAITNNPQSKLHAQIHRLRSAQALSNYNVIVEETASVLSNAKLTPETAVELRYYRAKAYLAKNRNEIAVDDLSKLANDTRSVYGAEAKYLLAQLYYDTNRYDKAEQEVLDYINVSTPHRYWLARSFVLLSDVYVKKDKLIEAKQYLLSLKQSYQADDDIASMVENRLQTLAEKQ